jgi:hypothetical protein
VKRGPPAPEEGRSPNRAAGLVRPDEDADVDDECVLWVFREGDEVVSEERGRRQPACDRFAQTRVNGWGVATVAHPMVV